VGDHLKLLSEQAKFGSNDITGSGASTGQRYASVAASDATFKSINCQT
jgi:hypothetical protein